MIRTYGSTTPLNPIAEKPDFVSTTYSYVRRDLVEVLEGVIGLLSPE